jgi:hypothetical protein
VRGFYCTPTSVPHSLVIGTLITIGSCIHQGIVYKERRDKVAMPVDNLCLRKSVVNARSIVVVGTQQSCELGGVGLDAFLVNDDGRLDDELLLDFCIVPIQRRLELIGPKEREVLGRTCRASRVSCRSVALQVGWGREILCP